MWGEEKAGRRAGVADGRVRSGSRLPTVWGQVGQAVGRVRRDSRLDVAKIRQRLDAVTLARRDHAEQDGGGPAACHGARQDWPLMGASEPASSDCRCVPHWGGS